MRIKDRSDLGVASWRGLCRGFVEGIAWVLDFTDGESFVFFSVEEVAEEKGLTLEEQKTCHESFAQSPEGPALVHRLGPKNQVANSGVYIFGSFGSRNGGINRQWSH